MAHATTSRRAADSRQSGSARASAHFARLRQSVADHRPRRIPDAARPFRLGQDHLPDDPGRLREADARPPVSDGVDITDRPADKRTFGMVFQGYALFPHMTVEAENIAFPLKVRKMPAADIKRRVGEMIERVGLSAQPEEAAGAALRRPAAARGAGPRAGVRAGRAAARRAVLGARQEPARPDAGRDEARCTRRPAPPSSSSPTTRARRWRCPSRVAIFNHGQLLQVGRAAHESTSARPTASSRSSSAEINLLPLAGCRAADGRATGRLGEDHACRHPPRPMRPARTTRCWRSGPSICASARPAPDDNSLTGVDRRHDLSRRRHDAADRARHRPARAVVGARPFRRRRAGARGGRPR